MSWNNPTKEEAADAYGRSKNRYENAAANKRASEKREQQLRSKKATAINKKNALTTEKINLEKRLEGVKKIINMLDGNGGFLSVNVPSSITTANRSLKKSDSSYRGSLRSIGGVPVASIENAFLMKTVEQDKYSSSALSQYKTEKKKLEDNIDDLKIQISSLAKEIESLTGRIYECQSEQAEFRHIMVSSAYDMNHYKRHMY